MRRQGHLASSLSVLMASDFMLFVWLCNNEALNVTGIPTIISYNEGICNSTFTSIITDKEHRLNMLLPAANNNPYSSRKYRRFAIPKRRTDRFRNTFIMSSCLKNNVLSISVWSIYLSIYLTFFLYFVPASYPSDKFLKTLRLFFAAMSVKGSSLYHATCLKNKIKEN